MEFRSVEEIMDYYFPKTREAERIAKMNPEEYDEYIAVKLLDDFKSNLKK